MNRLLLSAFLFLALAFNSGGDYKLSVENHRKERNEEMRDTARSPLKKEEIEKFRELNFYPVDESYRVEARYQPDKKKQQGFFQTSNKEVLKQYEVKGIVFFTLRQKECSLTVYQLSKFKNDPVYKNQYFIPFTDLTNGNETYGGGRYLDLERPKGKKCILDFNLNYNPYCAYTTGYSCPIPPKENHLDLELKAGEKILWEDH